MNRRTFFSWLEGAASAVAAGAVAAPKRIVTSRLCEGVELGPITDTRLWKDTHATVTGVEYEQLLAFDIPKTTEHRLEQYNALAAKQREIAEYQAETAERQNRLDENLVALWKILKKQG